MKGGSVSASPFPPVPEFETGEAPLVSTAAADAAAAAGAVVDVGAVDVGAAAGAASATGFTPTPGYEETTECRNLVDKIPSILKKLAKKRKAVEHEEKRKKKKYYSTLDRIKKAEFFIEKKHAEMQKRQEEIDRLKATIAEKQAAVEMAQAAAKKLEENMATENETGFDGSAQLGVFLNSLHALQNFVTSSSHNHSGKEGGEEGEDNSSSNNSSSSGSSSSSNDSNDSADDDDDEDTNKGNNKAANNGTSSSFQETGRRMRKNSNNPFTENWRPLAKWPKWMHQVAKKTWQQIYNDTDCQKCRGQMGLKCAEMAANGRRGGCVAAKKLLADAKASIFVHPMKGKKKSSKKGKKK